MSFGLRFVTGEVALAYKAQGDIVRAVESLQKALALGDFPEARDAKMLLEKV